MNTKQQIIVSEIRNKLQLPIAIFKDLLEGETHSKNAIMMAIECCNNLFALADTIAEDQKTKVGRTFYYIKTVDKFVRPDHSSGGYSYLSNDPYLWSLEYEAEMYIVTFKNKAAEQGWEIKSVEL